ncbi:MAG: hypothetical protein AAGG38_03850 [Planctomycetota bacterium]
MMTQKLTYWVVASVLGAVVIGGSVMWWRSYSHSEQAVVRAWFKGVAVLTTDRGRLAILSLGEQPTASRWVLQLRSNGTPAREAPRLDELCRDHGLGFGVDQAVAIAGAEQPAVAGVNVLGGGVSWGVRRVVLPFWAVVVGGTGLLLVWTLTYGVRVFRSDKGLCVKCSYDISGASHFCPKCGKPIARRTWSGETRPRRRVAATR